MLICGEHDREEIAYEGRTCPACKEVDELKEEIKALKARIADVVEEAQAEINTLTDAPEQWRTQ